MGLSPNFPTDPHAILDPQVRWHPGEDMLADLGYEMLLPPLVYKVRRAVKAWRDSGYAGACDTTRALLRHWFETEHHAPGPNGAAQPFAYYFAQREAVESAIWLYEVERARDSYALIKFDSSGRVSKGMFSEDWPRYVLKLATGAGKTKVMSLLLAWAYFHKRYEPDSDLSTNFLIIAPNIIVLTRLRDDFGGLRIFAADPVLPPNGYEDRDWQSDFQMTLHVQDEIGLVSEAGNLFLTNIHRVYESDHEPSFDDANTMDYFLGRRPTGKTNESQVDLGRIVREVPDLVVMNDEAHHIHDPRMGWFKNMEDIAQQLRLRDSRLSLQVDLTATPRHTNGAIFVETVSDYPLVEAIRQRVTKTPVLPDVASRARLHERQSSRFTERYEDYLHLGYLEWKKRFEELAPTGKKSVLFVMTDDTRNCDEVGEFLERRYPELRDAVLVIHTRNNGMISEAATGKSKEELARLRELSRSIDRADNPYKAIVSVMVLREGWDVQNVVAMVGLRPYGAKSQILPEQTLGRGLRRMFREEPDLVEKVSVVGTDAFMDFVESIRDEGVELEYAEMGEKTHPRSPVVVEVDRDNPKKDLDRLDIDLPVLAARLAREYKNLSALDVDALPSPALPLKAFSAVEQREIVFKDIDTQQVSHTTVLDSAFTPTHQSAVGFFTQSLVRDLRLVGGQDILFGQLKRFMETRLFDRAVDLDDLNVLRNLSEIEATRAVLDTFRAAINALTVQDRGTTEVRNRLKLSQTRPFIVNEQGYLVAQKSVFNKVVGDNDFELDVAAFLEACPDTVSFAKNSSNVGFYVEYRTNDGGIARYFPDFLVKATAADVWIIETKGRVDLEDPHKWARLVQWCADATALDAAYRFHPLFVRQERWDEHTPHTFHDLCAASSGDSPQVSL